MKRNYFEGWYLKHQKDNNVLAFIPGITNQTAFIQVMTNDNSYYISYPLSSFMRKKNHVQIGNSLFSQDGIRIDINDKKINVVGEISYSDITPIKYDIMGIFKFFPMECRHAIISMHHNLNGSIKMNDKMIPFTDGIGYIEKDSGTSFPKSYLWIQCNDFMEKCSIMLSIADIPFGGFSFKGCICVVYYRDREYRLATYWNVTIECFSDKMIMIKQGKYRLIIDILKNDGHSLLAPHRGDMVRTIHESVTCTATFKFLISDTILFDLKSNRVGFEFVDC